MDIPAKAAAKFPVDHHTREDLAQIGRLALWRKPTDLPSHAYTRARGAMIDYLRGQPGGTRTARVDPLTGFTESWWGRSPCHEDLVDLVELIDLAPHASTARRRWLEDKDQATIAAEDGVTQSAVSLRLTLARSSVARELQPQ